jgi:hypothetical protein
MHRVTVKTIKGMWKWQAKEQIFQQAIQLAFQPAFQTSKKVITFR